MNKCLDSDRTQPRIPVRRNGIATKARLIEAAFALMARHDAPLTMRALAKEAGCSPAAAYQFFVDKDDLSAEINRLSASEALIYLQQRLPPGLAQQDPQRFIRTLLQAIEELQERRPETLCMGRPQPPGPRAALAAVLREAVLATVRAAFRGGHSGVDDAKLERSLQVAQSALLGTLAQLPARENPEREPYLDAVARLIGGFLDGLQNPAPSGGRRWTKHLPE